MSECKHAFIGSAWEAACCMHCGTSLSEYQTDRITDLEAQLAEIEALQRYHMMIVQHPYPRDICVTTESDGDWIMYNELTAILAKDRSRE